jgi:hypothetical protein
MTKGSFELCLPADDGTTIAIYLRGIERYIYINQGKQEQRERDWDAQGSSNMFISLMSSQRSR